MDVNIYYTEVYENISDWTLGENKPNSNPIKACPEHSRMGQFPKGQKMNLKSLAKKFGHTPQTLSHRICLSRSGELRYNGCCPFCYKSLQIEKDRIFGRDRA